MAERLSLKGYADSVYTLSDAQKVPSEVLSRQIGELEQILAEARTAKIGRQVTESVGLLKHYVFEQMMREGRSSDEVRDALAFYEVDTEVVSAESVEAVPAFR